MVWRTQLGPTEEVNPATDNASTPFQLRMEKMQFPTWRFLYGNNPMDKSQKRGNHRRKHQGQNPLQLTRESIYV